MKPHGTPEEAARGDIPAQFVQVVGVVVRGDRALVAQLTNDGPPFEVETAYCSRSGAGWSGGSSGNSTAGYLPTGERVGTVVVWDEAPPGATEAKFAYRGRELVVPVENGCALAVFDDVAEDDVPFDGPRLVAWRRADGTEEEVPTYEVSDEMRAQLRSREGRVE
jgi:hypothetical protein